MDYVIKKEIYAFDETKFNIGKPYAIYFGNRLFYYAILAGVQEKELIFYRIISREFSKKIVDIDSLIKGKYRIVELKE